MIHNGNTISFSTLLAIVSDPDLDTAVAELREAEEKVTRLHGQLHDAEIEAQTARSRAFDEAHQVLRDDAGIAHAYANEA